MSYCVGCKIEMGSAKQISTIAGEYNGTVRAD